MTPGDLIEFWSGSGGGVWPQKAKQPTGGRWKPGIFLQRLHEVVSLRRVRTTNARIAVGVEGVEIVRPLEICRLFRGQAASMRIIVRPTRREAEVVTAGMIADQQEHLEAAALLGPAADPARSGGQWSVTCLADRKARKQPPTLCRCGKRRPQSGKRTCLPCGAYYRARYQRRKQAALAAV